MDCRSFRKKHMPYLDDTLPGVEMAEIQRHLRSCVVCSRQDASVRRSLLLLRNLPPVQPTDGFSERLRNRLALEDSQAGRRDHLLQEPRFGVFAGAAASVIALGVLAVIVVGRPSNDRPTYPTLPAVVAQGLVAADAPSDDVTMPAFVASMSTGMPVWPALLLAEEGSLRFATTESAPASWTPVRRD